MKVSVQWESVLTSAGCELLSHCQFQSQGSDFEICVLFLVDIAALGAG